ncbi:UNVERIFIED_CONTAM: helicase-related protein, partial [Kocuria sp. CPCC 205274]
MLLNALKTVSITMKTEEAIDLPKQTFIDIMLEHDRPQVYAKVKKHQMYESDLFANPGVTFTRLREFASGYIGAYRNLSNHKAIALKEFLESNDKNVSIFYNFHAELDDITLVANELGIKLFVVKGGLSEYEAFKEYKGNQRKIIAINYGSGAEGLNLQELDTQIYYSPCIPFIKYEQSLARIHRIGQTKPVFYYRYITKNTIEERIYQSLAKGEDYNERLFMKEEY